MHLFNELKKIILLLLISSCPLMAQMPTSKWHDYNLAKKDAYLLGMTPTAKKGIEIYLADKQTKPNFILNIGASTGQEVIPLAQQGCQNIWAVDPDEEALNFLQDSLNALSLNSQIRCIKSPFLKLEVNSNTVDLLIATYVLPYISPNQFQNCWRKCHEVVKPGGYIAADFFGPFSNRPLDPEMTYHTEQQVKDLFAQGWQIVWFEKEPEESGRKTYGGNGPPPSGDLYRVVAKKQPMGHNGL